MNTDNDLQFLNDLRAELDKIPDYNPDDYPEGDVAPELPAAPKKAAQPAVKTAVQPAAGNNVPAANEAGHARQAVRVSAPKASENTPAADATERVPANRIRAAQQEQQPVSDATVDFSAIHSADFTDESEENEEETRGRRRIRAKAGNRRFEALDEEDEEDEENEPRRAGKNGKKHHGGIIALIILAVIVAAAVIVGILFYGNVYPVCEMELGHKMPDASAFTRNGGQASYAEEPNVSLTEAGSYWIMIKTGFITRPVYLTTVDTTAPSASDANATITLGSTIQPEDTVTTVHDASAWTASWKSVPDLTKPVTVNAVVILRDSAGNSTEVPVTINIVTADEAAESTDTGAQ